MHELLFVWLGGALFVASLAVCAYDYLFIWSRPALAADVTHAVVINTLLFGVFAFHHTIFARELVKAHVRRLVPDRLLRSVYVWIASAVFILVCTWWRPVGGDAYHVTGWRALAHAAVQLGGLSMMVASVRVIDPLELAGIRQRTRPDVLQIVGPYRWVRHPLYLGWILAVFGAAHMTANRAAFAAITSFYLFIAVPWEERSLERTLGGEYQRYKRAVRWRIVPFMY